SPADIEVKLIAREAAEPGADQEDERVEQALRREGGGEDDEGFAFDEGPQKGNEIEPPAMRDDHVADVELRHRRAKMKGDGPDLRKCVRPVALRLHTRQSPPGRFVFKVCSCSLLRPCRSGNGKRGVKVKCCPDNIGATPYVGNRSAIPTRNDPTISGRPCAKRRPSRTAMPRRATAACGS